jgi:hypothetical protein
VNQSLEQTDARFFCLISLRKVTKARSPKMLRNVLAFLTINIRFTYLTLSGSLLLSVSLCGTYFWFTVFFPNWDFPAMYSFVKFQTVGFDGSILACYAGSRVQFPGVTYFFLGSFNQMMDRPLTGRPDFES